MGVGAGGYDESVRHPVAGLLQSGQLGGLASDLLLVAGIDVPQGDYTSVPGIHWRTS